VRVRFGELRGSERRKLAALDARIERLFEQLVATERDGRWWKTALAGIHRELTGQRWDDGRYVVRSESRALAPVVARVVERAPAGLHVVGSRPPRAIEGALANVARQTGVDLSPAHFRAGFARGHLLEVVLHVPGGSGDDAEHDAAERLVWETLGERQADDWIGGVSVAPEPRGGPLRVVGGARRIEAPRIPLTLLAETVENAIRGLRESLPADPAWACSATDAWTLFELEPAPALDWAAQDDLLITSTCEPEMLKSFLSGAPFSSARFSRHGELYFYLKFASEGALEERLAKRSELEDALDTSLVEARAGRVVGGGLGLAYTYVDCVLSDVERGLAVAREVARAASLSPRSWLLPFDDDLRAEWLEVQSNAPAPPGLVLAE